VIRVARIDFSNPSVILLAVPRDLWVTIPGLDKYGISEERIKISYPYGNVFPIPGGGPSLLAQTLSLNLGLHIDHYLAMDFAAFAAGIDKIGGIDIYLPNAVGNPTTDPPYFAAGWNHMDGATALSYSRVRPQNTSDLNRIDRQTEVIIAARHKLLSSDSLPLLPGLISSMKDSVVTDLSPADISSLVCIAQQTEPGKMVLAKIDKPLVLSVIDSYGYERLLPSPDRIRDFIKAFDAGDQAQMRESAQP
jgi:LCP family protein required for cell wall assembly